MHKAETNEGIGKGIKGNGKEGGKGGGKGGSKGGGKGVGKGDDKGDGKGDGKGGGKGVGKGGGKGDGKGGRRGGGKGGGKSGKGGGKGSGKGSGPSNENGSKPKYEHKRKEICNIFKPLNQNYRKLFVGNIPFGATKEELKEVFDKFVSEVEPLSNREPFHIAAGAHGTLRGGHMSGLVVYFFAFLRFPCDCFLDWLLIERPRFPAHHWCFPLVLLAG